jgi:tetraacyldisaccharide 4'-kinase
VAWAERVEAGLQRLWWQREPGLAAQCLRPLSWLFAGLSALRRASYTVGWRRAEAAPVPLLVVGNLVAGGAGKTPTVIALVQALREAGWAPGVVSRGHGRRATATSLVRDDSTAAEVGDEPLLIHRRTGAPVAVAARRIDAARTLCAAHADVDVLVADDGLQHLALARDVQVVVFDERGIGNGLLLPAGPLRQPQAPHVPVNTHVLYNAAQPSTRWPGALAQRHLAGAVELQAWWHGAPATRQALHALQGRRLLAAAGMAAPERFFAMLRDAGLTIDALPLPDHHDFASLPWPADDAEVLVTEKDAVKLPRQAQGSTRIWVVTLDFALPDDFTAAVLHNLRLTHRP